MSVYVETRPRIVSTRKPLQAKNTECSKCLVPGDATVFKSKWWCNSCLGRYLFDYTSMDSIRANRWLWAIYKVWKDTRDGNSPYDPQNYGLGSASKLMAMEKYKAQKPIKFSKLFPDKPDNCMLPADRHMRYCRICQKMAAGLYAPGPMKHKPRKIRGPFTLKGLKRLLDSKVFDPSPARLYQSERAWLKRKNRVNPGAWLVGRNA